jgi:hypothetical protein
MVGARERRLDWVQYRDLLWVVESGEQREEEKGVLLAPSSAGSKLEYRL